jgi:diguanylate cyclase (GGDEF)-like protein
VGSDGSYRRTTGSTYFQYSMMLKTQSAILPRDPDPAIYSWLERVEYACLALLMLISATNVLAWLMPTPGWILVASWLPMKGESGVTILLSTFCLMLLGTGNTIWKRRVSPVLAGIVVVQAAFTLVKYPLPFVPVLVTEFARTHGLPLQTSMTPQTAGTLLVLGLAMIAMAVEDKIAIWIGDALTLILCVLTFTLVSGYLLGKCHVFGTVADPPVQYGTLLCLFVLTILTLLRRSENGVFSIYADNGNAGNLARILSPIILLLPFARECTRAGVIGMMPSTYVVALLASMTAVISISVLLYLVWRINMMETEISALALRDELTGLLNLRGFQLLADQAMRLAQRSKVPFSVMFIDLDDLKVINDSLGHQKGSGYISEAAEILRETFRETDVLGRIGGDEFAVAGQFNQRAMTSAVQRLNDDCARRNKSGAREFVLSLSVGHATLQEVERETLEELMARADEAMYEVKRVKKERQKSGEQGGPAADEEEPSR